MEAKMSNPQSDNGIVVLVFVLMLAFVIWLMSACTTNHYFSVNADEMTNPRIEYHDSTTVQNPF